MTAKKLAGRRIVITGAANGMGEAIAELFAAEGASLALFDRDEDRLDSVASNLGATAHGCDVASVASVEAATAAAQEAMGGLDGVVNAAGVFIAKPFAELDHETWNTLLAVNLTGPFNIVRAALPALQAAGKATIVNIASLSGLMPAPGTAGYSASKAGLLLFTKGLACDLAPTVRVNAICPGIIQTEMTRFMWGDPAVKARSENAIPVRRLGQSVDVAAAALYLTSDDSSFVNGTQLVVDGGSSFR